jgi:hypothetical protein
VTPSVMKTIYDTSFDSKICLKCGRRVSPSYEFPDSVCDGQLMITVAYAGTLINEGKLRTLAKTGLMLSHDH